MKSFNSKSALAAHLTLLKDKGLKIGLVPTMGALHQGHLSLIEASKKLCDITVVSIFVNPTQFNNATDLLKYPKPITTDIEMLQSVNCDILFNPEVSEMYSGEEQWNYEIGTLNNLLEGEFRPNHYLGVTQIVFKLFDLVKPDSAFFGQKDYQQFLVVKKMTEDLNLDIDLYSCPIIREADGLAMSSRNIRLNNKEREKSLILFQSLTFIKENYLKIPLNKLKTKALKFYENEALLNLEYLEICDSNTLVPIHKNQTKNVIVLVACMVGETRLIDNMMLC